MKWTPESGKEFLKSEPEPLHDKKDYRAGALGKSLN